VAGLYNVIGMWKTKFGFTLVELLITIAIVGLMSSVVAIVAIVPNLQRGKDNRRKTDLESIRAALEIYHNSNRIYPALSSLSSDYISNVPDDPDANQDYYYSSAGQTYVICAKLYTPGSSPCPVVATCGSAGNCNYGLTQP